MLVRVVGELGESGRSEARLAHVEHAQHGHVLDVDEVDVVDVLERVVGEHEDAQLVEVVELVAVEVAELVVGQVEQAQRVAHVVERLGGEIADGVRLQVQVLELRIAEERVRLDNVQAVAAEAHVRGRLDRRRGRVHFGEFERRAVDDVAARGALDEAATPARTRRATRAVRERAAVAGARVAVVRVGAHVVARHTRHHSLHQPAATVRIDGAGEPVLSAAGQLEIFIVVVEWTAGRVG